MHVCSCPKENDGGLAGTLHHGALEAAMQRLFAGGQWVCSIFSRQSKLEKRKHAPSLVRRRRKYSGRRK